MFNFKNKRVFISGGAGVIGMELVKLLHAQGALIFIGDLKKRPPNLPENICYRQGDLNYISSEELSRFAPHYFFHLAATFERSLETYEFWNENFHHNTQLSNHLMTCLRGCSSLKKVIFASSYLIYDPILYTFKSPQANAYRLDEESPIAPRNLCGAAKLYHEAELDFLRSFNKQLEVVSVRIFRSYGKNSRDIISRWIRDLLQGRSLNVFCKGGRFDYIYAGDVAQGLIHLAQQGIHGIVNLGNDNARSIEDVLAILKRYFPEMQFQETSSDILYEASQSNMQKCENLTGWRPTRQLEDTIPEIIAYEKTNELVQQLGDYCQFNTLITSVSKKVQLIKSVRNSYAKLGNIGKIYGADAQQDCIGRFFVDEFWHMPTLDKLKIQDLIDYCQQHAISYIIPTRDGELSFFAQHKKTLKANGVYVMISDDVVIQSTFDKLLFYQACKQLDIPAIETALNIDNKNDAFFVVKERFGAGSLRIGLCLSYEDALVFSKQLDNPIFQPFIKGDEYSIDVFVGRDGVCKGAVVRRRDVVVYGESQITTIVRNVDLESAAAAWAEKLKIYGHAVFQVFITQDKNIFVIECNARFGGASSLSVRAGINSFYWFFLEGLGENLRDYFFIPALREMKQVRYAEDLILEGSSF